MIMMLLSIVTLLALSLVNLTIARHLGGIDPQRMFKGDWLSRPYHKSARAAARRAQAQSESQAEAHAVEA